MGGGGVIEGGGGGSLSNALKKKKDLSICRKKGLYKGSQNNPKRQAKTLGKSVGGPQV